MLKSRLLASFSALRDTLSGLPTEILFIQTGEILLAVSFFLTAASFLYFFFIRKSLKSPFSFLPILFFLLAGTLHVLYLTGERALAGRLDIYLVPAAGIFALAAWAVIRHWLSEAGKASQMLSQLQNEESISIVREKLKQSQAKLERELRQAEEEMGLLPSIMEALEDPQDFAESLEIAVRRIAEKMEWACGEAWLVSENGKVLEYSPAWYGEAGYEPLRRISHELKFPPGIELAGRVWASQKPELVEDVAAAPNGTFFRVTVCKELGLKAALAVPVIFRGKTAAVVVFLMKEFQEKDKRRMAIVITAIKHLFGLMIEKKAAEKDLRASQLQQEKKIRERTRELLKTNEILETQNAEHERTEAALRKSQENFSTMLNSLDGIVWEFDLQNSKFTFVSEQAERMLGYPAGVWFAEPAFWQDHVHGGDRAAVLAFRSRAAQEKKSDQCEYRMITSDGKTIWVRDMVTVVVEEGEAVKLRGVMVNITEPKQAEEALNQERNFVSAVFETASALVMVLDTEGRVVRFNRACEQTSGYSAEEAKGKYFWEVFSVPEETANARAIFNRLLAGQFPINDEGYWTAKDGLRRAIAWSSTVLLNRYGAVVHVIATGVDITKRKEIEQKLKEAISDLAHSNRELDKSSNEIKEANRRLRDLDEIKSHFISAASHELRTPLTSIKGYVESVLEDEVGPLNEKQREFLGYVKTSTERLHRLLNELLDISKIESGQVKMDKDLTNLKDLLQEEVMIFKAQAGNKNISLNVELDPHLREIYCDADKVKEIMDNLISNAVKYTSKGGHVTIAAKNYGSGIQIDVEDTGIGIQKEDLNRIFEPFQHIEKNGTGDEESTGLGLTLVKRIAEAHEGNVSVKSEEGKGSIFTVVLPLGSRSEEVKTLPWAVTRHE